MKPIFLVVAMMLGVVIQAHAARAQVQTAVLAGGCFWCVEADFDKVNGVIETTSGFAGGTVPNPTYKQVTRGGTGHYEVVRIRFDSSVVSYREILDLFLRSVDVTDAGGQFCDRGDSYRTAIFARPGRQTREAREAIAAAQAELGSTRIVTPVLPFAPFYAADSYHQNYYQSSEKVLTRFGLIAKKDAYKRYRRACGRDARVRQIWGSSAAFVGG